mmetsp:Transcript_12521/g.41623  ORF Transcript_12521/g.41623 Transcript_12521/m.41623 type:complete len:215 (-) Transcript_12521:1685-2329(-)
MRLFHVQFQFQFQYQYQYQHRYHLRRPKVTHRGRRLPSPKPRGRTGSRLRRTDRFFWSRRRRRQTRAPIRAKTAAANACGELDHAYGSRAMNWRLTGSSQKRHRTTFPLPSFRTFQNSTEPKPKYSDDRFRTTTTRPSRGRTPHSPRTRWSGRTSRHKSLRPYPRSHRLKTPTRTARCRPRRLLFCRPFRCRNRARQPRGTRRPRTGTGTLQSA